MNIGKKIIIGGSITLTTQAVARYTPSIRKPSSHHGNPAEAAADLSAGWTVPSSKSNSMAEGTFAPATVSHSTMASIRIMMG